MIIKKDSNAARVKRHQRVRNKISGTPSIPRLCVYRSANNIYVQIIDDVSGSTLVAASSLEKDFGIYGGNKAGAKKVGEMIAKKAIEKGISNVVFDRGGYIYHGRVQALADAAREGGLRF